MPADMKWEQIADELPCAFYISVFCGFNLPGLDTVVCVQTRWLCANAPLDFNQKTLWGGKSRYSTGLLVWRWMVCLWVCVLGAQWCPWNIQSLLPYSTVWQILCFYCATMLNPCFANMFLGLQSGDRTQKTFHWLNVCGMKTISIWEQHLRGKGRREGTGGVCWLGLTCALISDVAFTLGNIQDSICSKNPTEQCI